MNDNLISEVETIYKREDVFAATLEYFGGDEMAADVWINKYALKDSNGNIYELTPDDMHKRIAKEFARIESKFDNSLSEKEIYNLLKNFKYIVPQGSPMAGIGNKYQVSSLSNCFVIGNDIESDSYGGILKLDQELVQLMKRRAGVGLDLSFIRPMGSPVKNSALTSTGVVPYMERYSNSTREVAQDGRRGALMESISINHPDAESFIDAKMDETKVTGANVSVRMSDEFMNASINENPFISKYPVDSLTPSFTKSIDAKKLWDKIIYNAWFRAEPGILFWDTIIKESIPDCYDDLGFKTTSTNPCLAGETMVAVADGRGEISIKELAEQGEDVPVYCYNENGKISIRYMRNPRITGYDVPVFKLTLDDGSVIRATELHKFKLKSGEYVELKNLKPGDSLQIMTKYEASIKDIFPKANSNSQDYLWLKNGNNKTSKSEHRLIAEFYNNCKIENGYVVHHKDYNSKNNSPQNLEIMTHEDHINLHKVNMIGDKNPMRRAKTEWSKEKWALYSKTMSEAVSGELNGRYSGFSEEDLRQASLELTTLLQRRFSTKDWQEYAKGKGLPSQFSNWRNTQLNGGIIGMAKWASMELGFDKFVDEDPRLVKTYYKLIKQGYDCEIIDGNVFINKLCEVCNQPMQVKYIYREASKHCNGICENKSKWSNPEIREKMIAGNRIRLDKEKELTKNKQLEIYSKLKFDLKRFPLQKEWEKACQTQNTPYRIGKHSPFKKYSILKEEAESYNHRVVSIEFDKNENVYNGTVDEFHNFFVAVNESKTSNNKRKSLYINNLQCGEITLCNNDSCRLLILNLYSYVINPFTSESKFDFKLFEKHVKIAQRLMDDLIELELEKIDAILSKIELDPEPDYIKYAEKQLWLNIKEKCINGRRTGLGITAEGDMLAALGIRYGTNEGNEFSNKVHQILKIAAYSASVDMAKDRGSFPIYNSEREENNPFIQRIKEEDPDLYSKMCKYGRRNIALLTIAPTGSVSILTQTTSGIEPAFLISYMRRRKINPNDTDVRVDFTDKVGDTWQNYPIFHHKFKDYLIAKGYNINEVEKMSIDEINKLIEDSPYFKATANDVDWVKKVEMQGMIQKHVDHSISVTVNLPKSVTQELVAKVYEMGWKSGCKGITVYRDGCRSGVLISNEESKTIDQSKIIKNNAPKRPKTLDCDIYQSTANGEQWVVIVGLLEGDPYEVFAFKPKKIHIPSRTKNGKLTKIKKGRYDLDIDGFVIENLSDHFETDEQEALTRMISMALRHGSDTKYIIDQLNKSEGTIVSFGKSIARTLKRYISDDEKSSEICSNCEQATLVYQEGCLRCTSCGLSKCG